MSTGQALVVSDNNKLKPSSKPQGVAYVGGNETYISTDINADAITRYDRQNFLFARTKSQQMNLIFPNPYTLQVLNPDGEVDEELSKSMKMMCDAKDVNLWMKMQLTYSDIFGYGAAIFNPVWKYKDNEYRLEELNYLPAETFGYYPGESFKVPSEILVGIGIDNNGNIQFYQADLDGNPVKLTNVVMIKNPIAKGVAGTPLCLPIIPLISGSKFGLNAQMQKVNRVGAPTPFIRINDPNPANSSNGNVSDEDYAQMWLKNYSKDILMPLRENMETVDSFMEDNGSALETIEYLNKQIIDFWSPSSMIAKDGTLIGGSSASELGLLMRYISSVHEWLENPFEELLQIYLDANGYEGYRVVIEIPEPEIDTTELDLKKAEVAKNFPGAVKANALLKWLDLPEDETLKDKYLSDLAAPAAGSFGSFSNTEDKPTPKQAEKKNEEEQKDAWDTVMEDVLDAIEEDEE